MTTEEIISEFSKYFHYIGRSRIDGYPIFRVDNKISNYIEHIDFERVSSLEDWLAPNTFPLEPSKSLIIIKIKDVRLSYTSYLRGKKLERILDGSLCE